MFNASCCATVLRKAFRSRFPVWLDRPTAADTCAYDARSFLSTRMHPREQPKKGQLRKLLFGKR